MPYPVFLLKFKSKHNRLPVSSEISSSDIRSIKSCIQINETIISITEKEIAELDKFMNEPIDYLNLRKEIKNNITAIANILSIDIEDSVRNFFGLEPKNIDNTIINNNKRNKIIKKFENITSNKDNDNNIYSFINSLIEKIPEHKKEKQEYIESTKKKNEELQSLIYLRAV